MSTVQKILELLEDKTQENQRYIIAQVVKELEIEFKDLQQEILDLG